VPSLDPVDERYFDYAPQRFAHTWSIAQPIEAVWADLVADRPLDWCRGLRISWTSPRPLGVGSTRHIKGMGGLSTGDDYFFIWEEGRRQAFYAARANGVPLFTSLAQEYTVEPDGRERCRFTWRVAATPSTLGRPIARLNKLLFAGLFRQTGRYFKAT
jgi:Polyketide cyclase / dehydrase and lipid transport